LLEKTGDCLLVVLADVYELHSGIQMIGVSLLI